MKGKPLHGKERDPLRVKEREGRREREITTPTSLAKILDSPPRMQH